MSEKGKGTPAPADAAPEETLRAELAEKDKLAKEYYDQLLRLKAEFENYRKRVDREKAELARYAKSEMLGRLLALFDVLSAAHAEIGKNPGADGKQRVEALSRGVEMLLKEFQKLFSSEGVQPMDAQGKAYDHERHDVMGAVEREDLEDGTVVDVLQPGYLLDGKVLRHAKVRISKKPAKKDDSKG